MSIVLRFVRPEEYGILSPPVERILNVNWGSDAVETYCNYLRDLRAVRKEVRFSRVADADMALWVLHAKCFGEEQGGLEVRKYYNSDDFLLKLRAKNVMGAFRALPLSVLARAMEDVRANLAGVVACYLVEIAIRSKAKSIGAKWQGDEKLDEVIQDLNRKIQDHDFQGRLDRCRKIRNDLFHLDRKPNAVARHELFEAIAEIERSLPNIRLGEGFVL